MERPRSWDPKEQLWPSPHAGRLPPAECKAHPLDPLLLGGLKEPILQLAAGAPDAVSGELPRRRRQCEGLWQELRELELDSSSESDRGSGPEEEEEAAGPGGGLLEDVTTPLTEFLSLKREAAEGRLCPSEGEPPDGKLSESPLLSVMSHLLSFLEQYGQLQRLQGQAGEYRARLRREETRRRKQLRALKRVYRQQVQDKLSLIESLEGVVCEQQDLLETLHGVTPPSASPLRLPVGPVGVHRLVESISALQGERAGLLEDLAGLRQQLEAGEKEKQQLAGSFGQQVQELKQQIEEREEELMRLRMGMGVTDSEKRIHNLTVENEGLKQSLGVTQGLLQQLAAVSAQPSAALAEENEGLRSAVQRLETSLQQKVEELVRLEGQRSALQWRKEEEMRRLDERIRELQLALETQRNRPPDVQYVTKMVEVEVESPAARRALAEAEERNRGLREQLSSQGARCQRLAEQLQGSEEVAAGLRHKISAYEGEMAQLRGQLLQEISHLEAQKEAAVQEATECSEQQLEQLREQLAGVQSRLAALQPLLTGMKSSYGSLRSQVRDFSQFYEAAIREARSQVCRAAGEAAEASQGLLEKYQREVRLREKYHAQLLELKGHIRVLCRMKPVTEADRREGEVSTAVSAEPGSHSAVTARYKGKERTFDLDRVFLPEATQEEVFLDIEPLVLSCLDGYNVCIFAYGQTGSGKTYTMEGVPEDPGINQRALQALYREMEARAGLWAYSVSLSMVEIYNEVIRDLLGKEPQEKLDVKLNPDGSGQLHVPGLTSVEVQGLREIRKMLSLGKRNRATSCTNMNEHSSRSHALLTVTFTGTNCSTGTKTSGLGAGAERGRDHVLPEVCRAGLQGGAGPSLPPDRLLGPRRALSRPCARWAGPPTSPAWQSRGAAGGALIPHAEGRERDGPSLSRPCQAGSPAREGHPAHSQQCWARPVLSLLCLETRPGPLPNQHPPSSLQCPLYGRGTSPLYWQLLPPLLGEGRGQAPPPPLAPG
ncbi:kinesin-like protein KIFC2 isoform X2 [Pelodiscus sinensis]|uniref:kinesin-like protein KIFC2 isoform X2 n=1 Tax=Pelodiscus sinensis TaxID=13735 RepID=UPI003F6B6081